MSDDRLSVHEAGALRALLDLSEEMERAEAKFPDEHLPDGTGATLLRHGDHTMSRGEYADLTRRLCQRAAAAGTVTWRHVLDEEVSEAFAESDPDRLRAELLQVATVALRWVIDIDGRVGGAE